MQQKRAFFRVCSLSWCLLLQVSVKMVFSPAACALFSLSPLLVLGVPPIRTQPEQVHLSYPGKGLNSHSAVSHFLIRDWNVLIYLINRMAAGQSTITNEQIPMVFQVFIKDSEVGQ